MRQDDARPPRLPVDAVAHFPPSNGLPASRVGNAALLNAAPQELSAIRPGSVDPTTPGTEGLGERLCSLGHPGLS